MRNLDGWMTRWMDGKEDRMDRQTPKILYTSERKEREKAIAESQGKK
jgi:hypothetical protein